MIANTDTKIAFQVNVVKRWIPMPKIKGKIRKIVAITLQEDTKR